MSGSAAGFGCCCIEWCVHMGQLGRCCVPVGFGFFGFLLGFLFSLFSFLPFGVLLYTLCIGVASLCAFDICNITYQKKKECSYIKQPFLGGVPTRLVYTILFLTNEIQLIEKQNREF